MGRKRRNDPKWNPKSKNNPENKTRHISISYDTQVRYHRSQTQDQMVSIKDLVQQVFDSLSSLPQSSPIQRENDFGDSEYKLKLIDTSLARVSHLIT